MARLIDADVLEKELGKVWDIPADWDGGMDEKCETAFTVIGNQPTVDAVEVVHGEWISLTDCSNAGVYCSVCKKKVWKEDYAWCNKKNKLRSNYCPNCGAKMDGGDK